MRRLHSRSPQYIAEGAAATSTLIRRSPWRENFEIAAELEELSVSHDG